MNDMQLTTGELRIRSLTDDDTEAIHRVLALAFGDQELLGDTDAIADRRSWVTWQELNARWFPRALQPPYGDRAITLAASGEVIGAVGFVPLIGPFDQIPELRREPAGDGWIPEFGLFWAIDPAHQGQGHATRAARAMIGYGLRQLNLSRILACTEHANLASQAVMGKAGMTLLTNPAPAPEWLQVVGVARRRSWT